MPTPSSARRWLIQAVFVSTRSPRSISVPMVIISALSMLFPLFMFVFYNPRMEDRANTHTLLENAEALAHSRLTEKRYGHTLRVADTTTDLARVHGLDEDRARLSALLHDAARETGP